MTEKKEIEGRVPAASGKYFIQRFLENFNERIHKVRKLKFIVKESFMGHSLKTYITQIYS